MLPQVLEQLQAVVTSRGLSSEVRTVIENYFSRKSIKNQRRVLGRLRAFAAFMDLPRDSWAEAIDRLLQLPKGAAWQLYLGWRIRLTM